MNESGSTADPGPQTSSVTSSTIEDAGCNVCNDKGNISSLEVATDNEDQSAQHLDDISQEENDNKEVTAEPHMMVHTAIIEKDNPFINQNDGNAKAKKEKKTKIDGDSSKVETNKTKDSSKTLINPNDVYDGDMEGLVSLNNKSSHSIQYDNGANMDILGSDIKEPEGQASSLSTDDEPQRHQRLKAQILEANKLSEGQGRTYIAYTIKYGNALARRRYSDFESLRNILVRLFPMTLLPPIPEKQSFKTYGKAISGSKSNYLLPSEGTGSVDLSLSVINGSVNNHDERLIRHRIRMLTGFLNKLLQNEEITKTTIISDFLDPNISNWNDFVTSSATFSSLPKSVLQCNPLDPTNTTRTHASLPVLHLTSHSLLSKDNSTMSIENKDGFHIIEQDYKRYESILNNGLYKYNRRITKSLHDLKSNVKELSEAYAQFANQSRGAELAEQFSYMSNVYDESSVQLDHIVGKFYYNINEPLGECVHMAGSAKDLIKYRKLKMLQSELVNKSLQGKKHQLSKLKEQEKELKMVENEASSAQKVSPSHQQPSSYSGKLLNKFNKLATMVKESVSYQDPDINSTMETLNKEIAELEESSKVCESDLKVITESIRHHQLKAFSKQREREITSILENYSKYMREYAEKNLQIWREIKAKEAQ